MSSDNGENKMNKLKFDFVCLILGSLFFSVYLMIFENSFLKFPQIIISLYLFSCVICFSLVFDNFERRLSKLIPSVLLKLVYLGLYIISPCYLLYMLLTEKIH